MKKYLTILLLCTLPAVIGAQIVNRTYRNKPLSDVLIDLNRASQQYRISFIYDELEDFVVSKHIYQSSIPDAIRQAVGFYPVSISTADSLIFIECLQKEKTKLTGRIVDKKKNPVKYANITVTNATDSVPVNSGVSNEDGRFVIPVKPGKVVIRISCIGYETIYRHCEVGDIGQIELPSTIAHIGEVVVKSKNHIVKLDKDVYLPNSKQRNAANSGIGLLANMMIPQLDVNRMTGDIKSASCRSLTLCIDDRPVDKEEIERLRPKDILRVEYIDQPQGKFAGKEEVLNIIVRHYDYGGYVALKSDTRFLYSQGHYSTQLSLDCKKMRYSFITGTDYNNQRRHHEEKQEHFNTAISYDKATEQQKAHIKETTPYGQLNIAYRSDSLTISGNIGLVWKRIPLYRTAENIRYTGAIDNNEASIATDDSRNIKYSAGVYAQLILPKSQQLNLDAGITIGNNHLNTAYRETGGYAISSQTRELSLNSSFWINYTKAFKHNNVFSLSVLEVYSRYRNYYTGTTVSNQLLYSSETLIFPEYSQTFGKKLSVMLRPLGLSIATWGTQNHRQSHLSSRAAYRIKYQLDSKSNLTNVLYLGNNYPDPSTTSELEQPINRYETLRGNPELGKIVFLSSGLYYTLGLDAFSLRTELDYEGIYNIMKEAYYPEGNTLIHSFASDGNLHSFSLGVRGTMTLLNKSLQLLMGVKGVRYIYTGMRTARNTEYHLRTQVQYFLGKFAFSGYCTYQSKMLTMQMRFYKEHPDYGFSASWSHKGFYTEVGVKRIFETHPYYHESVFTPYYINKRRIFNDDMGQMIYVKCSYNFDFGRKSQHHDIEVDKTTNSTILHR